MKASIANVIATTPLQLPYFDLEAYKSIEPMEARYRAAISEIDSKFAEKYGIDSLSEAERKSLLNKAKVQYALFEKQNPGTIKNEPKRNQVAITGERLHELFYDTAQSFGFI